MWPKELLWKRVDNCLPMLLVFGHSIGAPDSMCKSMTMKIHIFELAIGAFYCNCYWFSNTRTSILC